ncbi:MAG TPA: FecR domain-containing protein [Prolixibacteraceae bacterium]|nr:FecR domain-containing protein [Prolixibacteraceae bacterium]
MDTPLIEKALTGFDTERQKAEFEEWLQESEENSTYFEQLKLIWEKSGRLPHVVTFDETAAKKRIRETIHLNKINRKKTKIRRIWISVAASVLIVLGAGTFASRQSGIIGPKTVEYISQHERKEVRLPDGTHLWLNKNSKLTSPVRFRKNQRNVALTGEAYFEVTRDELRPFRIQTGKTVTKVLGTSFNIKMESLTGNVSIVVNSGKVAFYPLRKQKHGVELSAGDRAVFTPPSQSIQKGHNRDLNYLAWKTRILTFRNTPLNEVCKALEQYFDQTISTTLSDPGLVITGQFENEKMEDILSAIQLALDVSVTYDAEKITIYK